MDIVTLKYNPYTNEDTAVEFNGKKPLINSQVTKYQNRRLQDWLNEIPRIFHDEMNGYDFKIEYSGTKMDFEQLVKAFRDAGVTEEQVELFHKNEYNSREQELKDIDDILYWLANEPNNEIFDMDSFWNNNKDLLEEEYTIKTINCGDFGAEYDEKYRITVEDIDSVDELKDVTLRNTPIVVCVTRDIIPGLQSIVGELKRHEDIEERQVFFIIDDSLKQEMVKRIIKDHGIGQLQIVSSMKDEMIKEYYYAYPVTEHIVKMIELLDEKASVIQDAVNSEIAKGEKTSDRANRELDEIGVQLKRHKDALNRFENRANTTVPIECFEAREKLYMEIEAWKKSKVMIPEEQAEEYARTFNELLAGYYSIFIRQVCEVIKTEKENKLNEYRELYEKTTYSIFEPKGETPINESKEEYPELAKQFMSLKEERYVKPKPELKERLFGDGDFKPAILQTIYYCKSWRDHAVNILIPMATREIKRQYNRMIKELDLAAEEYIDHLKSVIDEIEGQKKAVALTLSKEEINLQNKKNWINHFTESIEDLKVE